MKDIHSQRLHDSSRQKREWVAEESKLDGEIKILVDKSLHAKTLVLSQAYEDHIEELSRKRQLIAEQIAKIDAPDITEDDALGTADYSLPFRVLRDMTPVNSAMVEEGVCTEPLSL